jgi:hypothetical protein
MATFARLKARTVAEIGGFDVTADATLLGEFANEAVRDVLLQTGAKVSTGTVTLTANTNDYTLDSAVLLIKNAYLDGSTDHGLTQVGSAELLEMRVRGSSVSSSDGPWYYALEGSDLFRVYPTPSSAGVINITYVPKPTEMSSDAHDPASATYGGIPTEFHPALLAYMYWKAASADDDQSSGQGERYKADYEAEIKKIRKYLNTKGNVRLPRAAVGRRRYVPRDPSADW